MVGCGGGIGWWGGLVQGPDGLGMREGRGGAEWGASGSGIGMGMGIGGSPEWFGRGFLFAVGLSKLGNMGGKG